MRKFVVLNKRQCGKTTDSELMYERMLKNAERPRTKSPAIER